MIAQYLIIPCLLAGAVSACGPTIRKRATAAVAWTYVESYDWGGLDASYELCQTGTMQAPIQLRTDQGSSNAQAITFNYPAEGVAGHYYNWGYGAAFQLSYDAGCTEGVACTNITGLPSFTFAETDTLNETVYLISWHVHAPADHTVQGHRPKAELHFVHVDANGRERAVLSMMVDPELKSYSDFFGQMPFPSSRAAGTNRTAGNFPNFNQTDAEIHTRNMYPIPALEEARQFNEFWTYRGSLTSPPCTEGVRFFVAKNVLSVSNAQMQDILRISRFSSRKEQDIWMHYVNL
ncbi:alpha carbonic anhydrase [Pseudomassariella vexata]|uniref:Alpha carbonic anhydrase n=1 Tax=Pseudomassariella vexata TaxID=1141098 RepID=A0A1Y2EJR9_9PEZI|nr:alpha carbonic anhydrase [Pseudomassariella vexata]ORY71055.1 alpha carbonic anhydrase [Pseudomassariella vexata]